MKRTAAWVLALGLVVVAGVAFGSRHLGDLLDGRDADGCTADVSGHRVDLDPEQGRNAALIAAIAVRRGLPARAVSIALAASFQESKLRNIDYGDRDSLGLFQQRPSQGWGTREQILNPTHAINAFYDQLEQVPEYTSLEITVAAQRVQRSGYPRAYAVHEADARALASALTGNSPAAFSCRFAIDEGSDDGDSDGSAGAGSVLTPRVLAVRADLRASFGSADARIVRDRGTSDARALDVTPATSSDIDRTRGWAMAQYLVAQADRLHISTVRYDGRAWTAAHGQDGWRTDPQGGSRIRVDVSA